MSDAAPMLCDNPSPQHLKLPLRSIRTPSPPRRHASPINNSSSHSTTKAAKLVTAIQMGHTRCLRRYIIDLLDEYSNQKPTSPSIRFKSSILDRRETPPRPDYEWITAKKRLFYDAQGSAYITDFEQTSSPLIWAVDCREWSCLRLMCTIQAKEQENSTDECSSTFNGAIYNPSQPQPVRRRILSTSSSRYPNFLLTSQNCICCAPESSPNRLGDNGGLHHEDIPAALKMRLRPLANLMLSVSFSNIYSSANVYNTSNGISLSNPKSRSFLDIRSCRSAQNSPRRDRSPSSRSPFTVTTKASNSIVLVGCLNTKKHSSRQWKRPTPYRAYWIRGSYTYQSVLDYFFATGFEIVGTHCVTRQYTKEDCEHCKQDIDYSDHPNYPTGPLDPRNGIFHDHFSQLERVLQSSGVSANRLDSVMAFNALAISAGRRLAGWCCHGAEDDTTIGSYTDEPLIEWRILSTLIDHGLNEFEWLEFLSPQQNFIGHALCVLAYPIHGWSRAEATSLASHQPKKTSRTFPGFNRTRSRRFRRRSSSPLGRDGITNQLPPAPLGAALRRQACLLLINLWSLGAFTSHHIVTRRSRGSTVSGSRIWDPRPSTQRSHSYTATMEGGDLRRVMLKTLSSRSDQMQMDPLEFLKRWTYFQAVWRSALSGTPLPEALNGNVSMGLPQLRRHQSPTFQHVPMDSALLKCGSRNIRTYQPICLKLLTRRAVRGYIARAEMSRRHGSLSALTPVLTIPSLQRFLGYFHSPQHMLGAPLPTALQILLLATASPSGDKSAILQCCEEGSN
nr:conserved hypothetical protein [Hymenolepis microstoma]